LAPGARSAEGRATVVGCDTLTWDMLAGGVTRAAALPGGEPLAQPVGGRGV
jgi:hypothetical protein